MKAESFTKEFVKCLFCEKTDHAVSHIEIGQIFGPWYCDSCHKAFKGVRKHDGIHLESAHQYRVPIKALLEYNMKGILHLEVNHYKYIEDSKNIYDNDHLRYFFEKYTCPTNILKWTEEMYINSHSDVHGAFKLIDVKEDVSTSFAQDVVDIINTKIMDRALR